MYETKEWEFKGQADTFTAVSLNNPNKKYTFCDNMFIMGGYNIHSGLGTRSFSKTYSNAPTNKNMVYLTMTVFLVDSIDTTNDKLRIILAGYSADFETTIPQSGYSVCGDVGHPERKPIQVHVRTSYSGSSVTLQLFTQTDETSDNESYGFRDIFLTFYHDAHPSNSHCVVSEYANTNQRCDCPSRKFYQFPSNSGRCFPCDPTCAECTGPNSNQCTACEPHNYLTPLSTCLTCHSTCDNCTYPGGDYNCTTCVGTKFLSNVKHCVDTCPHPLEQSYTPSTDLCNSPCPDHLWAYWDKTCSNICNQTLEPLVEITLYNHFKICHYPCVQEKYLYWNKTCGDTCPYPLTNRTKQTKLFCDYPCADITHSLYWDKDCLPDCIFPLYKRIEGNPMERNYCDYLCDDLEYLYWNGSCMARCDFPLIPSEYKSKNFCNFPCAQNEVLYWDGTCQTDCHFPKTLKAEGSTRVRYYCTYSCDMGEFLYWNGTCARVCVPPLTYSYSNGKWFCHYPCATGEYLRWDGVCQSNCPSPLDQRIEAGNYYCEFPCPPSEPYLYWNGSCMASCDFPLQNTTQGSAFFCNFPCNSVTDILYWNGTCSTQCLAPLTLNQEGYPPRKYCEYKCNKETEYLYWNGTCSESCDFPYIIKAEAGLNYCEYPCTSTQFLYWNGSCTNQCSSPYLTRIESSGAQYCDFPCNSQSDYLYWNGTCSPYCLNPLTRVVQGNGSSLRHFCVWDCPSTIDFLYWNGSCVGPCAYPLIQKVEGGRQFCMPPCNSVFQYYDTDTHSCKNDCPHPFTIDYNDTYAKCNAPVLIVDTRGWFERDILTAPIESGTVTLIMLPKMMQYIRYLDIRMPHRLQRLALSQGRSLLPLKIGWAMPKSLEENFSRDILPGVFQRHNLPSSFIVNYWPLLTSMAIIILSALVFSILEKVAKAYHNPTWQSIFETLRILTRWSALIIVFATSIDDIILYSFLQFKTFSDSIWSDYTILGFIICILVILFKIIPLVAGTIFLAFKSQAAQYAQGAISRKQINANTPLSFLYKWQSFQILFRGFKTNHFIHRLFYLIYMARIGLPLFIVSAYYQYPLAVVILQVLINAIIIIYAVIFKPLTKKINLIQLLTFEIINFFMNLCALILTAKDNSGDLLSDFSYFLGDAIIFLSFIQNLLLYVFLGIKLFIEANNISLSIRGHSLKEKIIWLQLLALPLQQAGMGFEEMMKPISVPQVHSQFTEEDSALRLSPERPLPKNKSLRKVRAWDGAAVQGPISKLYDQYKGSDSNEPI